MARNVCRSLLFLLWRHSHAPQLFSRPHFASSALQSPPPHPSPPPMFSLVHNLSLPQQPWQLTRVQAFSIRRKTSRRDPYAWVNVGENEECPSSQPNKGSVKNRKHKKRMEQRQAFQREQAQARIKSYKAAEKRKEEARRKRWKEGAARARAWAEKQAQAKQAEAQKNLASPS
eukprot:c47688_g1_i1 orf=96-614(+)